MGRRDLYKEKRKLRRKTRLILLFCCSLLVTGICAVDYSTNILMHNKEAISILEIANYKTHLELSFFNKKVYINTQYLNNDLERLLRLFSK